MDDNDPVYRQVYPSAEETVDHGLDMDPFCEEEKSHTANLIHRYKNRAVLITGNNCAVHCRHCMRKRNWVKSPYVISSEEIDHAVEYCRENNIEDVIISGGDPLMIHRDLLEEILMKMQTVQSLRFIRIGTRLPVTDPERIDAHMLKIMSKVPGLLLMTHYNHPVEITGISMEKIRMIRKNAMVLNQSVLLKGVNDDEKILAELFMNLVENGIKPYYLHQCDLVKTVTHFWVEPPRALEILRKVRRRISGPAMPFYAIDLPGGRGKVLLGPEYRLEAVKGGYLFSDMDGNKSGP